MKILKYFGLIRPKQWLKNFFVFAPILFAGQLLNFDLMFKNIIAFIAFCFVSSSVYIINDISDIESDRVHKKKRFRPLASGEISIKQAKIFFILSRLVDPSFSAISALAIIRRHREVPCSFCMTLAISATSPSVSILSLVKSIIML